MDLLNNPKCHHVVIAGVSLLIICKKCIRPLEKTKFVGGHKLEDNESAKIVM